MLRQFTAALGIVGSTAGFAPAQFASERMPPLPAAGAPAAPALPPGYGFLPLEPERRPFAEPPPANLKIETALPADHAWALKPEHGAYFICVKSYSRPNRPAPDDHGPTALAMAEALAAEIRDVYRVQTFLFELISDERKAELAAIAAAREQGRTLAAQWDKLRQQAQLNGTEFLEPDNKIRFKTINYKDQIAVLVGPFQSDEVARKALDTVRKWPAPRTKVKDRLNRDTSLMDWGSVVRPGPDEKHYLQQSFINPYETATVVPNPANPRSKPDGAAVRDPFIVKLNEGRPYNLLTASKEWTLAVKSFTAPTEIVGRDAGNSIMRKMGSGRGADALVAGADQAESMAKMIRELRGPGLPGQPGQPLGLEAFVLHTRNASLVTVGQFDGPNDPALLQAKQLLSRIQMNVSEDRQGLKPVANAKSLFDNMMPIPIPRY